MTDQLDWYPKVDGIYDHLKKWGKEKLPLQLKPPMRLEFAQKWLGIGEDKLGNIIWTDETMISQLPTKQRAKEWMKAKIPVKDRGVRQQMQIVA